jgi:hypothetical protein
MQLKDTTATAKKPNKIITKTHAAQGHDSHSQEKKNKIIRKTHAAQGHHSHSQETKQNHKKNTCTSRTPKLKQIVNPHNEV